MVKTSLVILFAYVLAACSNKDNAMASLPDLSAMRVNLAFACVHETDHLPPLDPEADQLFKYGRSLEKKEGPKNFNVVGRYYRIAAAYGHYKANDNLQQLVLEGSADSPLPQKEVVDLAAQLIQQGVPSGYYDIGYYLSIGYGLKKDDDMSRRFFRKAADMGNPEAQGYVGNLLTAPELSPEVGKQMLLCAVVQGNAEAAKNLAMQYKVIDKNYSEAVKAFQSGVAAGNTEAASFLEGGFKPPPKAEIERNLPPSGQLEYLALPNDPERARRYKLIGDFIDANDGRNPKVPDIDQIVPLPPAALPAWDGTFQWQKEQDAAIPPAKPSDELINRLSKAKNLDPATGLPLPPIKKPLGTTAETGEPCPESGLWCAQVLPGSMVLDVNTKRRIQQGSELPRVDVYMSRQFEWQNKLWGRKVFSGIPVTWMLVAYTDTARGA